MSLLKTATRLLPLNFLVAFLLFAIIIYFSFFYNFHMRGIDGDIGGYFYGLSAALHQVYKNGEFPLWYPFVWCGVSVGHAYLSVFYPIYMIFEWLNFENQNGTLNFYFILNQYYIHYLLFAFGLFILSLDLSKKFLFSFLISLCVALSPFFYSQTVTHMVLPIVYLPYIIVCLNKLLDKNVKYISYTAILFFFAISSSPAFGTAMVSLTMFLFILTKFFDGGATIEKAKLYLKLLGTFSLVALLLCAIVFIGLFTFTSESIRLVDHLYLIGSEKLPDFNVFLHNPGMFLDLKNIFLGHISGNWWSIGFITLALCSTGIFSKNKSIYSKFAILLLLIIIPYGCAYIFHIIFFKLPILNNIREQYLYIMLLPIPLLILATEGLKVILSNEKISMWLISYVACIGISQIFLSKHNQNEVLVILEALLTVAFLLVYCFSLFKKSFILKVSFACMLILSMISGLFSFKEVSGVVPGFQNPKFNFKELVANAESIQKSYQDLINSLEDPKQYNNSYRPWRIFSWVESHPFNVFIQMGLNEAIPYFNPMLRSMMDHHRFSSSMKNRLFISNAKYVITEEESETGIFWTKIWDNSDFLVKVKDHIKLARSYDDLSLQTKNVYLNNFTGGVAWLVDNYIEYNDNTDRSEIFKLMDDNFNPQTTVAVNSSTVKVDTLPVIDTKLKDSNNKIDLLEYNNNSVVFKATLANDQIMVTSIPRAKGWHLLVDQNEIDHFDVNDGFIGAVIPKGQHDLRLYFVPPYFILSCLLFLLGIVFSIVIIVRGNVINTMLRIKSN